MTSNQKTVLITGCSSGFGRELVPRFLERGWTVIATLRNLKDRGDLFAQERQKYPGPLHLLSLDVTNDQERKDVVEFVRSLGRGLDVLINNAGYGLFGALEDLSESQLRRQIEVNFFGTALLIQNFLPLLRQNWGRIINVSSVAGMLGIPLGSGYCSSKFAMEGLSEALYYELKPHGVQVCLVEPGRHRTKFSNNMVWGENSLKTDSPYARQTANYLRRQKTLREKVVVPQENVIGAILKLTEMEKMPLRVPVGKDALAVKILQTLIPQRLKTAILSTVWNKSLNAKFPEAHAEGIKSSP